MNKTYDPGVIEPHWAEQWNKIEQSSHSNTRNTGPNHTSPEHRETYCIMLPPPNVTGSLHMGHGFQQTLMDILIRYHRMCGKQVLWQGGTDHAGIATQMVVERQLAKQGKTRQGLGREAFLEEVWKWRATSGDRIFSQMKRLGCSVDWASTCFTMDPVISRATYEAFIRLYDEGLIYKRKKLVNWDPQLRTALSDLEVEAEEQQGFLWFIRYRVVGRDAFLVVATTRPETLFGDVAVAVHPEDTRYADYIGASLMLPCMTRTIPVIADAAVDKDFGTGCVKITPAHDFNDYEMAQRHALPCINIFTPAAALNENVPESYRGLDRYQARDRVIADLSEQGLLDKVVKHVLTVPKGDRSGAVLEPYLTDQWFVKMKGLALPAASEQLAFIPSMWSKTYLQWLENIEDWCISRQLWWGHRIPIWYDAEQKSYAGADEQAVRARYALDKSVVLRQEHDVLDTWFSASVWPFATLGWPEQTERFKTYFPTQLLMTGFDIIFFWVARMVMMSLKLTGQLPFAVVYITGLIRDSQGKKMSKTKGNVLDPLDLIEGIELETLIQKRTSHLMQPQFAANIEATTRREFPSGIRAYGADALRFTFCALATGGRDVYFDMGRLDGYRNFCNKIWNVARYVLVYAVPQNSEPHIADRWILSCLQQLIQDVIRYVELYRFDLLAQTLYEFVWNEYCDWYVELVKVSGATTILVQVLETILRLLHPIMPFITEEIWQQCRSALEISDLEIKNPSVMFSAFPVVREEWIDLKAEADIAWLKSVVIAIRKVRSELNISPSQQVHITWSRASEQDRLYFQFFEREIKALAKADAIGEHGLDSEKTDKKEYSRKIILDHLEIFVIFSVNVTDQRAEKIRITKEIEKVEGEIAKSQTKLQSADYLAKAPADIVALERQRLEQWQRLFEKLILQRLDLTG